MKHSYVAFIFCGTALLGCGSSLPETRTAKDRSYKSGKYDAAQPASSGSLWQDSSRGLFADFRATRVGDIVTIRVDESSEAMGDATTDMDRTSSMSVGMTGFLGLTAALQSAYPDIDPEQLIDLMSESEFNGTGKTSRGSKLEAAIAVRVKKNMPNGDLYIEGTKNLLINDEELKLYVSGLIRPEDIETDNSVGSSKIADAEVEFSGQGVLTDNQRQGWLTRLLSSVNPF